jgi:hypothetical protein
MSDDTPTQRFDTPAPSIGSEAEQEGKRSRGLMIALMAIGAAILIAIIILVIVLLGRPSEPVAVGTTTPTPTASTSDTPTASIRPSATPTATAPPAATTPPKSGGGGSQPTGAAFTNFSAVTQVKCDQGTVNFTPPPIAIQVKWATVRTNSVWIVFGGSDAADSQFMQLPVSGNQSNFPYELDYPCGAASTEVTMTLVGSDGHHVQKHWTITNTGDKF